MVIGPMDPDEWLPIYRRILREFDYSPEADEHAARELAKIIAKRKPRPGLRALRRIMSGRSVVVSGGAIDRRRARQISGSDLVDDPSAKLVCAGDSCRHFLQSDTVPDVVVTDLDGDLEAQVEASRRGALLVVHAHGDNRELLPVVGRLRGPVMGTCQCAPPRHLVNPGGFTDGDRAVILALESGAREVILEGFDFSRPRPRSGTKRAKLMWAGRIISQADDGRVVWPAASRDPRLGRPVRPSGRILTRASRRRA